MISDVSSQNALAKKWNGPSFWSPAIGRRGGVTVLCSPSMRDKISVWQKDAGGRLLSLLISFNNIRINLLNINLLGLIRIYRSLAVWILF